ncbi:MAG TPA: hypothetical protein VN630_06520 [Rhodanobacteraceae bacterium]|nr:hypothetical protein [Rhodanobacteraceae bacterium]
MAGIDGDVAAVAGAVAAVAGPAIGALEADDGAVPAGVGSFGAWDWGLFPHAESTSAQATTSAGIFRFIIRSPWRNTGLSGCKAPHRVKDRTARRHGPLAGGA